MQAIQVVVALRTICDGQGKGFVVIFLELFGARIARVLYAETTAHLLCVCFRPKLSPRFDALADDSLVKRQVSVLAIAFLFSE